MLIERRRSFESTILAALCAAADLAAEPAQVALGEVVRVAGAGVDREVALGQAGERADEVGGQAGDQPRAHHHGVDVPVGVVVGEDRAAQVVVGAGGLQVAGRGEDRVDGVVRVLLAVAVRVGPVCAPRRRDELHPPERAGGGHVQVAAVVGLDLVDRREDLPADAVLRAGGLVDRKQERRDAELADDEVGDADRRGTGEAERQRRVVAGRAHRRACGCRRASSACASRASASRARPPRGTRRARSPCRSCPSACRRASVSSARGLRLRRAAVLDLLDRCADLGKLDRLGRRARRDVDGGHHLLAAHERDRDVRSSARAGNEATPKPATKRASVSSAEEDLPRHPYVNLAS